MAKPSTKSITKEDLERFLETEDDFEFELKLLTICQKHSPDVFHSGTYQDPISKLNRQYDFRMYISDGMRVLSLAIECKNLQPYYPLLVSQVPRTDQEAYHCYIDGGAFDPEVHLVKGGKSIYPQGGLVGKSTTQVGKPASANKNGGPDFIKGDADVYEKWSQAVASASDLIASACNPSLQKSIILPVLVVPDGTLWTVDYDESGKRVSSPQLSNACTFYLSKNYKCKAEAGRGKYWISHLNIYTVCGFVEFLENAKRDMNRWF
ncbi:hypothetical protein [Prosthecobacter sp.]|jgi:hypothetical protein|uniref:hypothetical protein n=1 Tax=Prosthecobacter sp. TaxID=1965333 RepID=UPI0037CA7DD6